LFLITAAWTGEEEDQDENHIWQDDWDDDTVEDDFSNQLRYNTVDFIIYYIESMH
jgi:hypothetical protein